jgi:hypothetical protein
MKPLHLHSVRKYEYPVKFEVGDLVRITNENAKFAKGNEQTF